MKAKKIQLPQNLRRAMKQTAGTILFLWSPVVFAGLIVPAARPRAFVDVSMPAQSGRTWQVAGGNVAALQSAINHAACGDTLALPAGSTYNGNFSIPSKSCDGWIVIQSTAIALLRSGTRVTPSQGPQMAALRSIVAGKNTLQFLSGSHHWRLIGLEITTLTGMTQNALLETDGPLPLPHHIIIDRCYLHGDANAGVRRGISLQVSYGAVIDSDIREIHQRGVDSQAIGIWNGAGPYLIRNNFLSAASENLVIGGSTRRCREWFRATSQSWAITSGKITRRGEERTGM